ncbi:T9SS type A sorting domain-containing protein [Bacteroidota bacterium]
MSLSQSIIDKILRALNLLLLVILLSLNSNCFSQNTKVLFIGSSLTAFNNLPGMFDSLAADSGRDVLVVNGAIAGQNLTDHLSIISTMERLNQENYDYIILENGDYGLIYDETKQGVWNTIDTYIEMIHSHCTTTKIIIFMDWAMKNGLLHDGNYYSYETFTQMIYDATMQMAQAKNLIVAPIGYAWDIIVKTMPQYELYAPDNGHPSASGSYLGACVYYSVIFQESIEGNLYTSSLDEIEAYDIQAAASNSVLDNLELWQVITSIEENDVENEFDKSFALFQNYPNPFNPNTQISFNIPNDEKVELKIYDIFGREVKTLLNELLEAGYHEVEFSASRLASGMYIYSITSGSLSQIRKMMLVK